MTKPEHSIYSWPGMEPVDTLELHVLARAYRAAWRSIHARDPMGWHVIDSLHVMIAFDARPVPGPATTYSKD
jgi:hypothetical protein